jgi:hypothetical protein
MKQFLWVRKISAVKGIGPLLQSPVYFALLVFLLFAKVLWNYWSRDLTTGDTSAYFRDAVLWHNYGKINIVWSPLYTAYYGMWLNISESAVVATFLHRLGLLFVSTTLVACLGYITLPRLLALALTTWWIALPIHFDTLYEVHLFGALPMLAMAIVCCTVNDRWRFPVLIALATSAAVLIRNEYVLAVGIFLLFEVALVLKERRSGWVAFRMRLSRLATVIIPLLILVAFFYSISSVKGSQIGAATTPKHTLNMCQVYAFGYQQRNSNWKGSPWTNCSILMQQKFGAPMPSLGEMIRLNPKEVARHFLWNLSLTRAGFEVLLFNVTSSSDNPDYAPVITVEGGPGIWLAAIFIVSFIGLCLIYLRPSSYVRERQIIEQMSPLLVAGFLIGVAVITTQRPRPSYLLAIGVLFVWTVLVLISALASHIRMRREYSIPAILSLFFVLYMPTYSISALPSTKGTLGTMYNELLPFSMQLCRPVGHLALGEYYSEINNYLCSPYYIEQSQRQVDPLSIDSMPVQSFESGSAFLDSLNTRNVGALVIDPYFIFKHPALENCGLLQKLLLDDGWRQLQFREINKLQCVAAYTKSEIKK